MGDPASPESSSAAPWTVRRILEWTTAHLATHASETPRLDAEILLAHARGCQRIELYTHFGEIVSEDQRAIMRDLVRRRAAAEPVAYLVGHREFFSLDFRMTPAVLVPRPDTETLIIELLELAKRHEAPRILDVCTGSGCIAVAIAVNLSGASLTAVDISGEALAVARENAQAHGVQDRVRFLKGDLFAPLEASERFDFIISNPPYVRDDEIANLPPDVRLHEPLLALRAGPEGLNVIRRLIAEAPGHLQPGGHLFVEISPQQAQDVERLCAATGAYEAVRIVRDLAGKDCALHAAIAG